ncbi:MAG: hypothetical protein IPM97_10165 [Bdellovibrionaceae bacterium]|nr:hypothetical protein [Pseudobdellovibrionaceae bacterium]
MQAILILLCLLFGAWSYAYETDQYSVPPGPLADIGEDLSKFVYDRLQLGVQEINRELVQLPKQILKLEAEIAKFREMPAYDLDSQNSFKQRYQSEMNELEELKIKLHLLQTEAGLVAYLHSKYSASITWNEQRDGVFGAGLEYTQYPENSKNGKTVLYSQSKFKTIYSLAGFHRLISPSYFVFASTMKVYGIQMGVDKFGHFLNQGYEYYERYQSARSDQLSHSAAVETVVDWGVSTEDGLFGMIVDGVYSNADLAANFAGFIFYANLFNDLTFEGKKYPRILDRDKGGSIRWNEAPENSQGILLKRFMSPHLDESLNPSVLEAPQRSIVRKAIRRRCLSWIQYNRMQSAAQVKKLTDSLSLWNGYNYGHRAEDTLRIDEICSDLFP